MKNKAFTYFTAVFLLLVFFAKDIFIAIPIFTGKTEWLSLHEYDTDDESNKTKSETEGNLKLSETREFLSEHDFLQHINALVTNQNLKSRPGNTSIQRTFYLSIPTPPPDKA